MTLFYLQGTFLSIPLSFYPKCRFALLDSSVSKMLILAISLVIISLLLTLYLQVRLSIFNASKIMDQSSEALKMLVMHFSCKRSLIKCLILIQLKIIYSLISLLNISSKTSQLIETYLPSIPLLFQRRMLI